MLTYNGFTDLFIEHGLDFAMSELKKSNDYTYYEFLTYDEAIQRVILLLQKDHYNLDEPNAIISGMRDSYGSKWFLFDYSGFLDVIGIDTPLSIEEYF